MSDRFDDLAQKILRQSDYHPQRKVITQALRDEYNRGVEDAAQVASEHASIEGIAQEIEREIRGLKVKP